MEPTSGVYRFNLPEHHIETGNAYYSMMLSGQYSDVTLSVNGQKFKCHKMILTATCPYFKVMFSLPFEENQSNDVEIKDVQSSTMEILIKYMYKGEIDIAVDNAQDIVFAADMFQLDALKDACSLFLQRQLKTYNCLGMWNIARQLQIVELEKKAWNYVMTFFLRVAEQEEFFSLDVVDVCQMLSDEKAKITSEEVVCKSAINWILHKPERMGLIKTIVQCIHLAELNPVYIRTVLMNHTLFKNSSYWRNLFQQILDHLTMNMPCPNDVPNLCLRLNTDTTTGILLLGGKVSRPMSRTHDCTFVTIDPNAEYCDVNSNLNLIKLDVLTQLPATHKYTSSCSQGNTVFISGMGNNLKGFWKFDNIQQWARCKNMKTGRNGHTLLSGFTNSLFVVGGSEVASDVSHNISSIEEYNILENSWCTSGTLSLPVCYAGGMFFSGKIFVMGGFMSNRSACNIIQMYDAQTGVCVKLETRLPRTMAYCKGVVVKEYLMLVDKEFTLVFNGKDLLGVQDEGSHDATETSEHEDEVNTVAEEQCDSLSVWNFSPEDETHQNPSTLQAHNDSEANQLSPFISNYNQLYKIKSGCGVELAAAEYLGNKLIVFGGRKDIKDVASNRMLSRSVRAANVNEFLQDNKNAQPNWKLVGRLNYPTIVFMTAKIKIKK